VVAARCELFVEGRLVGVGVREWDLVAVADVCDCVVLRVNVYKQSMVFGCNADAIL